MYGKRDFKGQNNVERIIWLSGEVTMSEELSGVVHDWLLDDAHLEEKDAALRKVYDEKVAYVKKPSAKWAATLPAVKRRLGMIVGLDSIPLYGRRYFKIMAAAVILLVAGTMSLIKEIKKPVRYELIEDVVCETMEGVQKELTLADNSKVWMNSESRIVHPETFGEERTVRLDGEAYFEVERDVLKPFIVQTPKLEVKVIGTQFNVIAYPDTGMTEVFLSEGKIEVITESKKQFMNPGEKLTYVHETDEIIVEYGFVHDDWRSETMEIKDRTLEELFKMVANYYDVEIEFKSGDFSEQIYETKISRHITAEEIVRALSVLSDEFEYSYRENKIYIQKK